MTTLRWIFNLLNQHRANKHTSNKAAVSSPPLSQNLYLHDNVKTVETESIIKGKHVVSNSRATATKRDCSVYGLHKNRSQLCKIFPPQGNNTGSTELIKRHGPYCNRTSVANQLECFELCCWLL